jgi:hypothetical protein
MEPEDKTINDMVEERRKQLLKLLSGALHHLAVERYDVDVIKRKKVDIFNPEEAIFIAKADVEPSLTLDQIDFIISSIESTGYTVKRSQYKGDRLLLLV